jgi:hypothetical protein
MSYAYKARKKAMRRSLDAEDPERRQVRNVIRRGKAPRLTTVKTSGGKLPSRGAYRMYPKEWNDWGVKQRTEWLKTNRAKRLAVLRVTNFIRFTAGVIFASKARNAR